MKEGRVLFVEAKLGSRVGPGEWARFSGSALVGCPGCGGSELLDHSISAAGVVEPSLECPLGCGFHEMAQLDGWRFGVVEGPAS